jgi:hypothetical protein
MAGLPADRFTIKIGVNVHGHQTLRERTFSPVIHGFIQTIRDQQPDTPITVISPIYGPAREHSAITDTPFITGGEVWKGDLTLTDMRTILGEIVDVRRQAGDRNLDNLDGLTLFGPDDVEHLPDGTHPSPQGYALIGQRFARHFSDRSQP